MRYRLFKKTKSGLFFFQFKDNDNVIMTSQGYESKDARSNGLKSAIKNAADSANYKTAKDGDGKDYFTLSADNGVELARSASGVNTQSLIELSKNLIPKLKLEAEEDQSDAVVGKAYAAKGNTDEYKPLGFYESNGAKIGTGFDSFSAEDEHYFSYQIEDVVHLISEGYTSTKGRDNGINSVTKNMVNRDRYSKMVHSSGKHFFSLKAGNNQEIATSRWYDSEGDADAIITQLTSGGSGSGSAGKSAKPAAAASTVVGAAASSAETTEAPKKKKKKRKSTKPKVEKVFLAEGNYPQNDVTWHLFRSGNEKHYFTFRNKEGKSVMLNSDVRGFETQAEGQAKVDSVLEFARDRNNYEVKTTKNDKFYYYLKNSDGKNIGKSFFYNTTEEMEEAISLFLMSGGAAAAVTTGGGDSNKATKAGVDEYLNCELYSGHPKSEISDEFTIFTHDDEYYFAMLDAQGNVALRSEGYKAEKSRDNGINSVIKNRDNEDRWSVAEEDGKYFAVLKAGNNQEIGRGCPKSESSQAKWSGGAAAAAAATALAAAKAKEAAEAKAAEDARLKAEAEAKAKAEADAKAKAEAEAKAKAEKDAKLKAEAEAKAKAEADAKAKAEAEAKAKAERDAKLKAEAEAKAKAEADAKAKAEAEAKAKAEKDAKLKAEAEAEAKRKAEAKAKSDNEAKVKAAAAASAAALAATRHDQDEYLNCSEYKGHTRLANDNDFSTFDKDGKHYFAMLHKDGSVALRSQGYKSESGRDNGIQSVKKNRDLDERWSTLEEKGRYIGVLKAGNKQEIARSCPQSSKPVGWWKAAAPVAAVAAAAITPKKKVVAATPKKVEKKVVAAAPKKKVAAAAAAATTEKTAVATAAAGGSGASGCLKWLWWLIPLLLLLGLLWFVWKSCGDKATVPPVVDKVKTEVVEDASALAAKKKAEAEEAARVAAEAEERRLAAEKEAKLREETRAKKKKVTNYSGGNKNSGF